jgi:hypothetical protein
MRPWTFRSRRVQIDERIETLIKIFEDYLKYYDEHTPFGTRNPTS